MNPLIPLNLDPLQRSSFHIDLKLNIYIYIYIYVAIKDT